MPKICMRVCFLVNLLQLLFFSALSCPASTSKKNSSYRFLQLSFTSIGDWQHMMKIKWNCVDGQWPNRRYFYNVAIFSSFTILIFKENIKYDLLKNLSRGKRFIWVNEMTKQKHEPIKSQIKNCGSQVTVRMSVVTKCPRQCCRINISIVKWWTRCGSGSFSSIPFFKSSLEDSKV